MAKKKRLLSKVGSGVKKLHREAFRIIDQGLGICNKALEKTGIDKVLGGGSIGASTSYGSNGGHNVHYTPSNSSTSIGFGVSNNNATPSLFVNNQATILLTTPTAKFAIQSVEDRIAERDQLLREVHGPGYIPESSLATIGMVAIGHAATQFVNDTVAFVDIVSDVHADTRASIYNINDSARSEALSRNMDRTTNVAQSILKVSYNPSIIPIYYENYAQDAADKFSAAYAAGNLIGAGVATGQIFYDISNAAALTTGVVNFTAKAATKVGKSVNNFVAVNDFRPPIAFQFDYARLNSSMPLDSIKLQNPVVGKAECMVVQDVCGNSVPDALKIPSMGGVNTENFIEAAAKFLGDDFHISKPTTGSDLIMRSKDGLRQIRFDISNPHGLEPHINIETFEPRNLFPGDRKLNIVENLHVFPGEKIREIKINERSIDGISKPSV